ncbi:hypothetical protein [Halobacillus sp. Nhm2S1]|uniref:hypothetical protein n=1 Tax=Halobacillus sp. Nhm2S1 TaxID=2866716 RepID=UPI001C73C40D|nr:hypothetical protein [Halobacillus sp. Nhm2S1]MBX0359780.1 hypothetical protein [Halobacillus sp. Nhm2S1]
MPAWISNSFKILSSAVMHVVVTLLLFGTSIFTIVTGLTWIKGLIVIGLLIFWLASFVCVAQKLYAYLFGRWKDDDE